MPAKSTKKCPECGVEMRLERIDAHYRKVHPKADRSGLLTEGEREEVVKKESEKSSKRRPASNARMYAAILAVVGFIIIAIPLVALYFPSAMQTAGNAPGFALPDTNGNTVRLSDYRGKVVMLSFIDPKGNPCKVETQSNILPLYNSYGSRVEFITIDVQLLGSDTIATLKDFRTQVGAGWRFLLDDGSVKAGYGIDSTPRAYIIDRGGNIFYKHVGVSQTADLTSQLDKALG